MELASCKQPEEQDYLLRFHRAWVIIARNISKEAALSTAIKFIVFLN